MTKLIKHDILTNDYKKKQFYNSFQKLVLMSKVFKQNFLVIVLLGRIYIYKISFMFGEFCIECIHN